MKDELTIKSRVKELERVRDFIGVRLADLPFKEKERANVEFSLIEAVINAINHGNRKDPEKTVHITFESDDKKVVLSVTDQGKGFNLDKIVDPRDPKRISKPSGRGIFFMRQMMSAVNFDFLPSGTTVKLEKFYNG